MSCACTGPPSRRSCGLGSRRILTAPNPRRSRLPAPGSPSVRPVRPQDGGRDQTGQDRTWYRCNVRSLVPGSRTAGEHPGSVYLREDRVVGPVSRWIERLFDPVRREQTLEALISADDSAQSADVRVRAARQRVAAADAAMSRLWRALDAGWDPAELTEQYGRHAHARRPVGCAHRHRRRPTRSGAPSPMISPGPTPPCGCRWSTTTRPAGSRRLRPARRCGSVWCPRGACNLTTRLELEPTN
jgi:hypothetical protein